MHDSLRRPRLSDFQVFSVPAAIICRRRLPPFFTDHILSHLPFHLDYLVDHRFLYAFSELYHPDWQHRLSKSLYIQEEFATSIGVLVTMATVENLPPPASAASNDIYDSDDVGLHDSPLLKSVRPNLQPSPSPPPPFSLPQVILESTLRPPGRKGSNRSRNGLRDAVLVSFMGGGRRPDIARKAGNEPLVSDDEDAGDSVKGNEDTVEKDSIDLTALAADALRAHEAKTAQGTSQPAHTTSVIKSNTPNADAHPAIEDQMEDVKSTSIPSITASYV
ncbi:hypothetical protein DL95DRAFT_504241, partial [Leptodontidium sp. 2 PMI_412]